MLLASDAFGDIEIVTGSALSLDFGSTAVSVSGSSVTQFSNNRSPTVDD
jgi:hypothetical protein